MNASNPPFVVGLSGCTCSGKTSLGKRLSELHPLIFVEEPDPRALLVKMLREKSGPSPYEIQEWIIRERHRRTKLALAKARWPQILVLDRTLSEDKLVFFKLHHQVGFLSDTQLGHLNSSVDTLSSDLVTPNLFLFLTADAATLKLRLRQRPEGQWLEQHLPLQQALYDDFRKAMTKAKLEVSTIDTSGAITTNLEQWASISWEFIAIAQAKSTSSPG